MDEPTIPQTATFQLKLPSFEGPLDLLLHLIKKHELNILDLPMAFVTERYLDYLSLMEELDLDVASEYLLMAATLAHIKSKMLLPQTPASEAFEEQDEGYQEDPRAELIRRLLEYQKYKAAAEHLGGRPMSGRDVFPRGMSAPEAQGPAELAPIDMYKLLDAFQSILKRVQGRVALEVTAERITIHERMTQLSDFLRGRRTCTFEELFEGARTRYEVVVTFLALLEMTKLRMTRVYQADPKSALHVAYALLDENGELAEDVARAFEGVTADSTPPPTAAVDEQSAWEGEAYTAADGGDEADGEESVAADDWVAGDVREAAADEVEPADVHDAWAREASVAADGGEDGAPLDDPWSEAWAPAADGGESSAADEAVAPSVAVALAGHDAWLRDELVATNAGEDAALDADESPELAATEAASPDVWVRDELAVADDDASAMPTPRDAWVRDELAADGGDASRENADAIPSAPTHDAWERQETEQAASPAPHEAPADDESEPVSPNPDEWKP